ncbi:hypothetical protein LMG33818_002377 [Halomonadaceae bacterium LMG 33818]
MISRKKSFNFHNFFEFQSISLNAHLFNVAHMANKHRKSGKNKKGPTTVKDDRASINSSPCLQRMRLVITQAGKANNADKSSVNIDVQKLILV